MAARLWHAVVAIAKRHKTSQTLFMPSETGVVVIGGGAAGIAATRHLHDAGVDCLLVEARGRLGGRAFTDTTSGYPLDLGCGWLHSADVNPWMEIAQRQGGTIDRAPPPWMRPSPQPGFSLDEQRDFRAASEAFFARVDEAGRGEPDRPASDLLEPGNRWNALIGSVCTYIAGAEPELVSVRDFERYRDTKVNWRVVEGYGAAIAAHAHGVPVALNCEVRRIDRSGARLRIETSRGTIAAAQAIVALPTSIVANEDLFAPALPGKTEAARALPLGLADKLFIALDGAQEFAADSRLYGATDVTETATYHMRPFGRPIVEAYFAGRNAWALEQGGARAFYDFAVGQLTALLGSDFARRLKPLGMHLWGADPFARGSYSYAPPGEADQRGRLAAPVDGRLFFAGEACSPEFFTTAQGAYRTGVDTADAVLASRGHGTLIRPAR
jgi:monoamine oxidase